VSRQTIARIREAAERDPAVRLPLVASPVDVTDAEAFPEIAAARASFAARSPEEQARLLREWDA
jgi:hypothetical protein